MLQMSVLLFTQSRDTIWEILRIKLERCITESKIGTGSIKEVSEQKVYTVLLSQYFNLEDQLKGTEKFFLDMSEHIDLDFFQIDRNANSVS
jgi:hypothetical protein